jgi:hypothetical protein
MDKCPNCGQSIRYGQKICMICKYDVSGDASGTKNPELGTPAGDTKRSSPETIRSGAVGDKIDQRKKWLEQQKELMNEISGLKTTLGDDIKLKDDEKEPEDDSGQEKAYQPPQQINEPVQPGATESPQQRSPPAVQKKPPGEEISNFDVVPVDDILTEVDKSVPPEVGPPQPIVKAAGPQVAQVPKDISISSEDLIQVDQILENDEEIPMREYEDLAGAIDKVITHERSFNGTKKPKARPKPKPVPRAKGKQGEIDEIIQYLVKSISAQPDKFNSEPITNLLNKTQQFLEENNLDDALINAQNAKKAFTRMQFIYTDAEQRLKALTKKYPGILNIEHKMHNQYREILNAMKAGSYHRVNKMISDIESYFAAKSKPVVRGPPGGVQSPTARGPSALPGGPKIRTPQSRQGQQAVPHPRPAGSIPVRAVPTRAAARPTPQVPQPKPQRKVVKKKIVKHN